MTASAAETVGTRACAWGEGPVWWRDALWHVDIEDEAIICLDPITGMEEVWNMGQRVGFVLPCLNDQWIWGGDHGLYFFDPSSGDSVPIADPEPDKSDNRFNDAGISPDGRLFAGTIALDKTKGNAALYRLDPDHSLHIAHPNVTNSNGIAWSPDGGVCYYIDTPTREILRFRYYAQSGALTDPHVLIDTDPLLDASPDGMCVDGEGGLWVAFCHGGCVIRFDPDSGRPTRHLELPCRETTSCCFGGPDLRDLYVTTGIPVKNPEPLAGRTFVFRNILEEKNAKKTGKKTGARTFLSAYSFN